MYFRFMSHKAIFLCIILIAASQSVAAGNLNNLKPSAEIQRLLALPEDKIDIGIAALTFAKEIYPNLDITAYSRKIDDLADKVKKLANGTQDPEQRIRALNTVLFRCEGFRYDLSPTARSKQEYYFLNGILDTKQGICYTLPLLALKLSNSAIRNLPTPIAIWPIDARAFVG